MVRNWYNFTWLSGDGLVEQAVHTVDWLAWAFNDNPAASCTAVGGRQIPAEGGNIFDHVEINYVWANEARAFLAQRQIPGCHNENNLYVLGTKGAGQIGARGRGGEAATTRAPTDRLVAAVVDHEHHEVGRPVLAQRHELAQLHEHRAVAVEAHDLAMRQSQGSRDSP